MNTRPMVAASNRRPMKGVTRTVTHQPQGRTLLNRYPMATSMPWRTGPARQRHGAKPMDGKLDGRAHGWAVLFSAELRRLFHEWQASGGAA